MESRPNSRSVLGAGLAGGLCGLLLGLLGAQLMQPAPARAAEPAALDRSPGDARRLDELAVAVDAVAAAVEELRTELAMSSNSILAATTAVERRSTGEPEVAPGTREEVVPVSARSAGVDELAEVLERLEVLETISAQIEDLQEVDRVIVDLLQHVPEAVGSAAAGGRLPPIPMDTPIKAYLSALKSGDFETAPLHRLWNTSQVSARYGRPDKIVDHDDYQEWIYWLDEEGRQFDFHFVNGLCVEAH